MQAISHPYIGAQFVTGHVRTELSSPDKHLLLILFLTEVVRRGEAQEVVVKPSNGRNSAKPLQQAKGT